MRARRSGRGLGLAVLAACVATVLCALLFARILSGGPDGSDESGDVDAELAGEPAGGGAAIETTGSAFLDDLAGAATEAKATGAGACTAFWEEPRALPDVAGDVLDAYREVGTAVPVVSGYLDLKGNAWAAVLQDAAGWSDVVFVRTEDDAASSVRVTRLLSAHKG